MDSKTTLYAYRGIYKKKHVYIDKDGKIAIHMDGTNWLDGDTFTTATWKIEDSSTAITVSDTSLATPIATAYITCTDYGESVNLKVSATSDAAVPEICSRSFTVHRVRTV